MFKHSVLAIALTLAAASGASASSWGCTTAGVNFRDGPSKSYNVLGSINAWTKVSIDECTDKYGSSWCKVSWSSHYGWVAKKYLSSDTSYCSAKHDGYSNTNDTYSQPSGY